ncbi:MAG: RNA polymerase-binding protein DksA, partial [Comamonas sp.]|nr:RNA polymerase-binding protein DksA [Comamonas sp.]
MTAASPKPSASAQGAASKKASAAAKPAAKKGAAKAALKVAPQAASTPSSSTPAAKKAAALPVVSKSPMTTISAPLSQVARRDPKLADNWKNKPVEALNDAEVVAMPDSEYMNDTQLAYFRI